MTFCLGLTGSIGMGKSTTAALFAEEGCAVWDADAAVHRLYAPGGAAVEPLADILPDAIFGECVSRERLRDLIRDDPTVLPKVEAVVHPLVARDRKDFLKQTDADIVVFDIPLLFETGAEATMDAVACVTVAPEIQRQRVLARPDMTEARFEAMLSKQMSDSEKRKRADYLIVTDTMDHAKQQVHEIVRKIRTEHQDA